MKERPRIDGEAQKLLDMIYAPMYTQILFAAIELKVFSELVEAKTYNEVAVKLGLHLKNTLYLLNALTGMGLLDKSGEFYQNATLSSKYLVKGGATFIGEHLIVSNKTAGFDNLDIVKLVKQGADNGYENSQGLEAYEMFGDFTEMLKRAQRGGREIEIAALVASIPEFSGFRKMLDLGGGPGLLGLAVVKAHPTLTGVIFDTPAVGKSAEIFIKENNLEHRVEVMTGDYMLDSIGGGYDFIMAVGVLNFAKHDLNTIIKKLYDALNPQGVFMCISEGLTHEKTRPKQMVVSWLPSYLKGCDFSLDQGEISNAALKIGFKSVHKQTLYMLVGEMDLDIARK